MRAMVLEQAKQRLRPRELLPPEAGPGELVLRVHACGVCRTDLHVADGELPGPVLPLVLGHEIVGTVAQAGAGVERFAVGDRVGVPWLGWTCGTCDYCRAGRENLCDRARFTGFHLDGGYAELARADARYCFALPAGYDDVHAAPLLCAGVIGYRALRLAIESTAGEVARLGIYGFGAAGHLVAQLAVHQGRHVFAFARRGDDEAQRFARELGAAWAGASDEAPPEPLDATLIFAPVGGLVPAALRTIRKGGAVVCGGIHMSDLPPFPYALLWGERVVRSVANLTRRDGEEFLRLAADAVLRTEVAPRPLEQANEALADLRAGRVRGAAVLVPGGDGHGGPAHASGSVRT
jgi:propanol-preferring alcohol dehydrogenase